MADLLGGHGQRPAQAHAPAAGGVQSLADALDDQLAENSASAAKTWKTSRPPGMVVSRASYRLLKPTPWRRSGVTIWIRSARDRDSRSRLGTTGCRRAAGNPGRRPVRPVGVLAGQLVGEYAEAARFGQGVLLAVEQLAGGADPGVADQRAGAIRLPGGFGGISVGRGHTGDCRRNGARWIDRRAGFATPFTTVTGRRGARSPPRW